jgi:hypothetical protein
VKGAFFILASIIAFFNAGAQSKMIKEVFRRLSANEVYDLTVATRDSMLEGKTYYPADNDSSSIVAYNYGYSPEVKDYMYVSMSFETEQRGSGMVEIRGFKTTKGNKMILVSKTGGVWQVAYNQHSLSAFVYDQNKRLIRYKKDLFARRDESIFMKAGIPDSVKKIVLNNSNMTFNLSLEKLTLELNSDYLTNNAVVVKWLKGNRAEFIWNNDRFIVFRVYFD